MHTYTHTHGAQQQSGPLAFLHLTWVKSAASSLIHPSPHPPRPLLACANLKRQLCCGQSRPARLPLFPLDISNTHRHREERRRKERRERERMEEKRRGEEDQCCAREWGDAAFAVCVADRWRGQRCVNVLFTWTGRYRKGWDVHFFLRNPHRGT